MKICVKISFGKKKIENGLIKPIRDALPDHFCLQSDRFYSTLAVSVTHCHLIMKNKTYPSVVLCLLLFFLNMIALQSTKNSQL